MSRLRTARFVPASTTDRLQSAYAPASQIHRSIELPIDAVASKLRVQDVLHAIEELYFFRRYRHALDFINTLRSDGSCQALDGDARKLMLVYEEKCRRKLDASP